MFLSYNIINIQLNKPYSDYFLLVAHFLTSKHSNNSKYVMYQKKKEYNKYIKR